jgi:cell filamentation protein
VIDPYVDPVSGVFRNRLGISDRELLVRAESDISFAALIRLAGRPPTGDYDLPHLQTFHREIFGDLYPWAGELRTVEIAKSTGFCRVGHLESFAADIFRQLAKRDHLRGLELEEFLAGLADCFGDVNALHPFREGNGRTQRAFFGQLAGQAGYRLDWSRLDPDENTYASIRSFHGDNGPLRQMLATLTAAA